MVWGNITTGNKEDFAVRTLVSFETEGSIVKCVQDIHEWLGKEYSKITEPLKLEDTLWLERYYFLAKRESKTNLSVYIPWQSF